MRMRRPRLPGLDTVGGGGLSWLRNRPPGRRYLGSPIRYAGGKSGMVGQIVERFPPVKRIVSPFLGGGSVEVAAALAGVEVEAYDIFDILINYWNVQLEHPGELAERLGEWEPEPERYREVKRRLAAHWKGEQTIGCPVELAAVWWFNHNLSYGPGFLGWMSNVYRDPERYRRMVERVGEFRCPNLKAKCASFEETVADAFGDFLYLDPPYYLGGDSAVFRGLYPQRNNPVHHDGFRHDLLRDLLAAHRGGFALSYNDCSVIRDWYRGCEIVEIGRNYTMGQGETRIGVNRAAAAAYVKRSTELLIVGR